VPYLTWQYMAAFVEGEKRLKDDIVRRGQTAENHPFFDEKEEVVAELVDAAVAAAGYETPLAELPPVLKDAAAGILVGLLAETSSSREPWIDTVHKAGMAYLESVKAGEVVIVDADLADEPIDGVAAPYGRFVDTAIFDTADPDAAAHHIFPPLGYPRTTRWR
jgi:phage gp36-like protein